MPLTSSRKPSPLSFRKSSILGFRPVHLATLALAALSPSAFCQTQTPAQAPASPKPAAALHAKASSSAATDPGLVLVNNPSSAGIPSNWQVQASSLNGDTFAPSQLQGRVAVVFYWSTNCAVCRDTLPELRSNLEGWRKKPVAVVQVNVDKQAEDWRSYEQIRNVMHKPVPGLFSLRMDAGLSPTKLPLTLVVDAQNRVVRRYEGRIAPEAWNDVADLLP
ncbi:TlpA family protein disulfide reductase [Paucibacter sp. DJ1R-11]|uniref:TlpA family protein disulfide reductase n=1 Tax=Paucibacter sp. DJ1R-11 TaxID=2893556 RepID=UPI0021E35EBE|nr:TlpA disulfide reductase family protein [Paucibacter sp. DJ1R-11]MCV2365361.1 TlpA family protein disulfide reductase [Paucibacter sp. DJ1R-11]